MTGDLQPGILHASSLHFWILNVLYPLMKMSVNCPEVAQIITHLNIITEATDCRAYISVMHIEIHSCWAQIITNMGPFYIIYVFLVMRLTNEAQLQSKQSWVKELTFNNAKLNHYPYVITCIAVWVYYITLYYIFVLICLLRKSIHQIQWWSVVDSWFQQLWNNGRNSQLGLRHGYSKGLLWV